MPTLLLHLIGVRCIKNRSRLIGPVVVSIYAEQYPAVFDGIAIEPRFVLWNAEADHGARQSSS